MGAWKVDPGRNDFNRVVLLSDTFLVLYFYRAPGTASDLYPGADSIIEVCHCDPSHYRAGTFLLL